MSMKNIERKRNGLNVVQCFFFSAVACIVPYLSAHMRDIGITKLQSAWINAIVALFSMIGPLCLGPIAYKYTQYKSLLVVTLITSSLCYTGLLFVPRVIRTERQPKMFFDCTSGVLRVEQCPNWDGQCHKYTKIPATNFSNFQITSCSYECPQIATLNMSWYPVHVCFTGSIADEGNLCLAQTHPEHMSTSYKQSPKTLDKSESNGDNDVTSNKIDKSTIQFDTQFDRWFAIESTRDDVVERVFSGRQSCTYKPAPPLIVNHKVYVNVQCRPFVHNCAVYCAVNLQHRRKSNSGKEVPMRPPMPCTIETGDATQTFYTYLAIRTFADLSLFTAYTLLDALAIALTNDFDSIYGGFSKLWAIMLPMMLWPPLCGQITDYFSSLGFSNYAPPIIVFDGFVMITIILVIALSLSPINLISKSVSQTIVQNSPERLYPRHHNKRSIYGRLFFLFPLILILGAEWGLLETFLHPFYIDMGTTKLALGLTYTATFIAAAPFTLIVRSLINGVGRVHLIIIAFIFYALRFGGISYLLYPRWLIVPFEMMESFTLPIAWIGITSYCHHLIKRTPNAGSYESGPIFQKYSPHIALQYSLNLVHFGGGRALGAIIGGVWILLWPEYHEWWYWLSDLEIDYADDLVNVDDGFRVLLRLIAIISVIIGLVFLLVYHCCCVGIKRKRKIKAVPVSSEEESQSAVALNGTYSRLVDAAQSHSKSQNVQMQNQPSQTQLTNTQTQKKYGNGEAKIRMADEDDDDETPLTNR